MWILGPHSQMLRSWGFTNHEMAFLGTLPPPHCSAAQRCPWAGTGWVGADTQPSARDARSMSFPRGAVASLAPGGGGRLLCHSSDGEGDPGKRSRRPRCLLSGQRVA